MNSMRTKTNPLDHKGRWVCTPDACEHVLRQKGAFFFFFLEANLFKDSTTQHTRCIDVCAGHLRVTGPALSHCSREGC
jgi:hypothetical protein